MQEQALLRPECRGDAQVLEGAGPVGQRPQQLAGGSHSDEGANHPQRELQQPGSSAGGAEPMREALQHQRLQEPPRRLPRRLLLGEAGAAQHSDRLGQPHRAAERGCSQASRYKGGWNCLSGRFSARDVLLGGSNVDRISKRPSGSCVYHLWLQLTAFHVC